MRPNKCGIVGVINVAGLNDGDIEHFRKLWVAAVSRGAHACGIALPDLSMYKYAGPSPNALKSDQCANFLQRAKGQKWIIGHTRHATQGDPSELANDHPITTDQSKFLLVHNGVVYSNTITADADKTDSYVIAKAVEKHWGDDLAQTVAEAYKEFVGSAATAVTSKDQLVVAKRKNPIAFGMSEGGVISFASTREILKEGEREFSKVADMAEGDMIRFQMTPTGGVDVSRRDLPEPGPEQSGATTPDWSKLDWSEKEVVSYARRESKDGKEAKEKEEKIKVKVHGYPLQVLEEMADAVLRVANWHRGGLRPTESDTVAVTTTLYHKGLTKTHTLWFPDGSDAARFTAEIDKKEREWPGKVYCLTRPVSPVSEPKPHRAAAPPPIARMTDAQRRAMFRRLEEEEPLEIRHASIPPGKPPVRLRGIWARWRKGR